MHSAGSRVMTDRTLLGAGVVTVLCCAIGPAVIGAVAGSALGGWLGIACAAVLAAAGAVVMRRRTRRSGGC
jgi:hypothetical protein